MSSISTQNQKPLVTLLLVLVTISSGIFAAPVDKRNFLNYGYPQPFVTFQEANQNIATTEAANVNSLGIETLNAAEAAATFDNENLASLLILKRNEDKRNFLGAGGMGGGFQPFVAFETANENIATTEAANVNSLGIEALNACEAAATFDNENAVTALIVKRDENKRNFLNNGFQQPLVTFQTANENIATTEAANVNSLGIEALNAAEAAATFDNENIESVLILKRDENKRNFLGAGGMGGGFQPFVTFEAANENIATTEAANVNSLGVETLNACEAAATFDNENAATLLILKRDESKRNFLNNGIAQPFVSFQVANENIATTEAANVNSLEVEALNAAEAAATFDNENFASLLIV
ncbi:13611_t:CDS:1 [Acaulospora colombiana]|uniref:13611_t:CDS:1 n=1 Tax=Acaulospora colombiana TaxID=27376 RepID=A0ACA9KZ01_9GLOM|nr:13611_t:CDS:1 [Acaulospora colombiana]